MRVAVWTATVAMAVILLSGVVLAENKTCRNNCQGTNGSDILLGDGSNNQIYGLRGKDYVGGKGAADTLFGGTGNDEVTGGSGKDRMKGGSGVDTLWGRPGYDSLIDQPEKGSFAQQSSQHGAYQVQASSRPDRLLGGRGNDTIRARDGNRDIIRGGPGYDKAYVDRVDKVTGVEKEVVPGGGGGGGGTGGGPQQPKQCADGKDNDGDQQIDMQDPGCAKAADNAESPDPPPKQCADGKDNDGDQQIDMQDSGCASATDDTENTPPVAKDDLLTTQEGDPGESENVIFNDTDADGDTLSVSSFKQPRHGEVTRSTFNPSESLKYTPTGNYNGPDSFGYTVSDGNRGTDTGTVKVTVDPVYECDDGEDNDGDGQIDFGTQNPDPGCDSLTDDTENPNPPMGP